MMKRQKNQSSYKRQKGFSLVEVVVALLITVLSVGLMTDSLGLIKKNNDQRIHSNEIAFCYAQLTKFLEQNGGFKINERESKSKQLKIEKPLLDEKGKFVWKEKPKSEDSKKNAEKESETKIKDEKEVEKEPIEKILVYKTYVIEQAGQVLRVRGIKQGHMPLLVKIKNASFEISKDKFYLNLTEGNGKTSELVFKTKEATLPKSTREHFD